MDLLVPRVRGELGGVAADGDEVRVVGRVVHLAGPEALVADGHDDDDALVPGLLGGERQRVELVVLDAVRAERTQVLPFFFDTAAIFAVVTSKIAGIICDATKRCQISL